MVMVSVAQSSPKCLAISAGIFREPFITKQTPTLAAHSITRDVCGRHWSRIIKALSVAGNIDRKRVNVIPSTS